MTEKGTKFIKGTVASMVKTDDNRISVNLKTTVDGKETEVTTVYDTVLMAIGRIPCT